MNRSVVVLSCSLALTAASAVANGFRVTPYLQHPATDAMSVLFFTETAGSATVKWWPEAGGAVSSAQTDGTLASTLAYGSNEKATAAGPLLSVPYRHRVRLEGLSAGTRYVYAVELDGVAYTNSFKTAPDRNSSVRFIYYNDSETEPESTGKLETWPDPKDASSSRKYFVDSTTGYATNLAHMASRKPDFYAVAGDLAQWGGEQRDWDEFWRHNAGVYNDPAGAAPILAAPGNHDYGDGDNGGYEKGGNFAMSKYLTYFEYEPNNAAVDADQRQRFHRLDYGPVTLLFLDINNGDDSQFHGDVNHRLYSSVENVTRYNRNGYTATEGTRAPDFNVGSAQFTWITNQLADAQQKARFTFVVCHPIPYSVGVHNRPNGDNSDNLDPTARYYEDYSGRCIRFLTPYLHKYGVAGWLCGHDEIMEHSRLTGMETLPDGSTRPHVLNIFDMATAGDGLRGEVKTATAADPSGNSNEVFRAHKDAPEIYNANGELVDGGKHYAHMEINVEEAEPGVWTCTMEPVYSFVSKAKDGTLSFDRRVYDDVVVLTNRTETPTPSAAISGARYLRWHYTAIEGGPLDGQTDLRVKGGGNCQGMQLSEIRLMRDGEELAWPAGTTCTCRKKDTNASSVSVLSKEGDASAVIDGNVDTKCYDSDGTGKMMANSFAITLPEALDFDQYALYSADDDFDRDPTDWRLEVSADGKSWYAVDDVSGFSVPSTRKAKFYTSPTVALDLRTPGAATVGAGTVHVARPANAVTARHLRWTIQKMWKTCTFLQVSEFAPTYCGRRLPWNPSGTATCSLDSKYSADEAAWHLYDGAVKNGEAHCWHVNFNEGDDPVVVDIDLGALVTFDGYDICAGDPQQNDYRAPGTWTLEAQVPGTDEWVVISSVDDAQAEVCPFRRDSSSAYRVWHSDYADFRFWTLDAADERLTHCRLLPQDAITVEEGATLALSGIGGGFAAGSSVQGTLAVADVKLSVVNVDLSAATVVGTGTLVYPASAAMPPPVAETITIAQEGGTVALPADTTFPIKGKLKAVRMLMHAQLASTMFQFGELELYKGETKVAWPDGTTVVTESHGHPDPTDSWLHLPCVPNYNYYGSTYQNLIDGDRTTCMGDQYEFSTERPTFYKTPVDITILLGDEVAFDSYRLYAGDLPAQRLPTDWELQVSYDGVTFQTLDRQEGYAYPGGVQYKGGPASYTGTADWTKVTSVPLFDRVADDNRLAVAAGATTTVVSARERIAGLSGAGMVTLEGPLSELAVLAARKSEAFSGVITGDGTLVVSGGTLVMRSADLRGLRRIVVKSGAKLAGVASFGDSLVIEVEPGGVNALRHPPFVIFIR